jgi:hypothetical protein
MVSGLTTFEPSLEPSIELGGFDKWWEAYPKKVAKGAARKAYRSALRKTTAEELLSTLRSYDFPAESRFVPHPATWLNGECWTDDTTPPAPAPPTDTDPWQRRLLRWKTAAYWNSEWGPKPGKPGYLGPSAEPQDRAA